VVREVQSEELTLAPSQAEPLELPEEVAAMVLVVEVQELVVVEAQGIALVPLVMEAMVEVLVLVEAAEERAKMMLVIQVLVAMVLQAMSWSSHTFEI
jgi:hypothetical protein